MREHMAVRVHLRNQFFWTLVRTLEGHPDPWIARRAYLTRLEWEFTGKFCCAHCPTPDHAQ